MKRFDRALGIVLALCAGERCSATVLAERFGVSSRTIYRDVDQLSSLGVPVFAERGRTGGIRLLPGYFLPPVTFSTGEATSLLLGLALLASLRTVPFAADLDTARRKLLAALPDDLRSVLSDAPRLIGFERAASDLLHPEPESTGSAHARDGANEERALTGFARALFDRRLVHVAYQSPYRPAPEDVTATPLGLLWDRDRWYLAGMVLGAERPRLFGADRVVRLTVGPRALETAFDVRRLLGRSWLREAMAEWAREAPVTIIVIACQRDRLVRDWYYQHAQFESLADGRYRMTFGEEDTRVVLDLLRWLGPGAELVEPASWRTLLAAELRDMLATYDTR